MSEPIAGAPPGNDLIPVARIPVAEVCKIAKIAPTFYYAEARRGRAPKSHCGLTLAEATAWLNARFSKKVARAESVRRLRELFPISEGRQK
jgi:hypothetical protein